MGDSETNAPTSSSEPDPLGFNIERLLAGEASVAAGRYRPLAEALAELRARSLGPGAADQAP